MNKINTVSAAVIDGFNVNNAESDNLEQVDFDKLIEKFKNNNACIAVVGLGYVGLPLIFALYTKFNVIGFDIDQDKISSLNNNKSYIKHFSDEDIINLNSSQKFECSSNFKVLTKADAILICVPTPLTKNREPDMSYVLATTKTISKILRKGQLVVLESTTYPGTTQEIIKQVLEEDTKLQAGKDFFLCYAPEREDPGNSKYTASQIPKVIGADDQKSQLLAISLYKHISPKVVPVSSTSCAEAVKILENIFRCVNIALVNELKIVFDKMGINIWEVIEAAKTKPFGYMPFYPSPGLGGHCIPIDPFYLTWKAREYDVVTKFIELAGEINSAMPNYVISKLRDALDYSFSKVLNGAKILIIGMAYKKNVDDIRESPSLCIFQGLLNKKSQVDYFDPYITTIPINREYPNLSGICSIKFNKKIIQKYDAVIICTDHDDIDYQCLIENSKLIIDTRNATSTIKQDNLQRICKDNIVYA